MDITLFSNILKELILENDRVSLPGMGSFIAEMAPSVFSDRALVIHPPFRRILFRSSEIWNDGLLEEKYAKERGVAEEIAKHEISEFIKRLKIDLSTNKSYKIPGFGSMRATEQNDYFFVADKDLFNYVEGYGLAPINVKVLSKRGEVEKLTGKPIDRFFKGIPKDLLGMNGSGTDIESIIEEAGSREFDPQVITDSQVEEAGSSDESLEKLDQLDAIYRLLMEEITSPGASAKEDKMKLEDLISIEEEAIPERVAAPVPEPVVAPVPEPVAVPVQKPLPPITPKPQPVVTTAPIAEPLKKPAISPASTPRVVPGREVVVKPAKKGGSKFVKRFITIMVIIFLLIAAIALIIVFKDDLRPILEWILYSKEEREILKLS